MDTRVLNKNLTKQNLTIMLRELKLAPKIYSPSNHWQNLNSRHLKHLHQFGIQYFKRSINKQYFDWGVRSILYQQLSPILSELSQWNIRPLMESTFIDKISQYRPFNKFESLAKFIYRIYVAFLYDYVSRIDKLRILQNVSEPSLGSPLLIRYRNKLISQDLCNSVHEFYSITEKMNIDKVNRKIEVAEIGAGYARLAYVFLKTVPQVNYCVIDIPPALYIAQTYLKNIFPREKMFFFRHFTNFKQIEKEYSLARIRFLMAHQIEYLPGDSLDLIINISSFQEIRRDQIENYFKQIDRLCKGYFYFKQEKNSGTPDAGFIRENEYPIPVKWKKIYHHTHPIQRLFFEALYDLTYSKPAFLKSFLYQASTTKPL